MYISLSYSIAGISQSIDIDYSVPTWYIIKRLAYICYVS